MMLADKKIAWILNDHRVGNINQLRALKKYLENFLFFEEKEISFKCKVTLPNFLHIFINNPGNIKKFKNSSAPDFIFSAGRRSALAALKLKKIYPYAKIIQLMRPNIQPKYFSFITTPMHDNYVYADYESLVAPNFIDSEQLEEAAKNFPAISSSKFLVIIGGSSKSKNIDNDIAKGFYEFLERIEKTYNCNFSFVTSRRTDPHIIEYINNNFQYSKKYFWEQIKDDNPYVALLNKAENFIVTGDSVSMISDCLATGKPCIIYEKFASTKHFRMLKYLKDNSLIKFSANMGDSDFLSYKYKPINEAKNIAEEIITKFALR
jgi:mitochondrial fission protein ELM1